MHLIERLDALRNRWNVLDHPFYRRWECGELSRRELTAYAGEYRHAVVALAAAAETASPLAGPGHAAEERSHVDLWDDFARALGAEPGPARLPETGECVRAWTGAADPLEALGILYAIEAGQPDVSRTKLDGLVEHYGFAPDTPATAYFELHAERDHTHAAESRALLERHARTEDGDRVVAAAEAALVGNWTLLDGVERHKNAS
jgi:pyrroloquinoline-quinone synthase